jgi:hypothetical protein
MNGLEDSKQITVSFLDSYVNSPEKNEVFTETEGTLDQNKKFLM